MVKSVGGALPGGPAPANAQRETLPLIPAEKSAPHRGHEGPGTASEQARTASKQARTASEQARTASKQARTTSEQALSE